MGRSSESDLKYSIFRTQLSLLRKKWGYSYDDLAKKSGVSASYLYGIEQGKKGGKRLSYEVVEATAKALGVKPEQMYMLPKDPAEALDTPLMQRILPSLFRMTPKELAEQAKKNPGILDLLVQSLARLVKEYGSGGNTAKLAPYQLLRAYEAFHDNHFPEIEKQAASKRTEANKKYGWDNAYEIDAGEMRTILKSVGYEVSEDEVRELHNVRWYYAEQDGRKMFWVNPRLDEKQKLFCLASEYGQYVLGNQHRTKIMSMPKMRKETITFSQVLEDRLGDYFAESFLLPKETFVQDLEEVFKRSKFDKTLFMKCAKSLRPDPFFMRILSVLNSHFSIEEYSYYRLYDFVGQSGDYDNPTAPRLHLTKVINHTKLPSPASVSEAERRCRRFKSSRLLEKLRRKQEVEETHNVKPEVDVQISYTMGKKYTLNDRYNVPCFLVISVAYPLFLAEYTNSAVTIAIRLDRSLKEMVGGKIKFLENVIDKTYLSITCERCPLSKVLPEEEEGSMGELGCRLRRSPNSIYQVWELEKMQESFDLFERLGSGEGLSDN